MSDLWRPVHRLPAAQALYDAAEADRREHPQRYTFDPDVLIAAAGYDPAPRKDADWREGFDTYVAAARDEGLLNALGARSMAGTAIGRLKARASLEKRLAAHPETRDAKIVRPIFIIGGWRTGTTLLQRLMAAVPTLRAAYPAELSAPWRVAAMTEEERQGFLRAGEKAHGYLHLLNPTMQSVHPSGGLLAEECVLAMGTDFRNWGFTSTLRCPTYADWLSTQDMRGSYRRYADILRMLQGEAPTRWVLKAPAHTGELAALLSAFPDADIVHLHRDVVDTVTSGSSLFAVFRSTYSDQVDPAEVGAYQMETTARWFERAMAVRAAPPVGARFLDLPFQELVADPVVAVRRIGLAFDVDWDDDVQAALAARRAELDSQHGAHRYTPQQFGLDPDQIRERFAAYSAWAGLG